MCTVVAVASNARERPRGSLFCISEEGLALFEKLIFCNSRLAFMSV